MDDPGGVANAPTGSLIALTIVVMLADAYTRWIITVHGMSHTDFRHYHLSVARLTIPRVGGVVGENSFKFFVQFVAYTCISCVFVATVMGIFLREQLASTVRSTARPNLKLFWIYADLFVSLNSGNASLSQCSPCKSAISSWACLTNYPGLDYLDYSVSE